MRINGFEQIKGFYSWVFENQDRNIRTPHISLYMFLVNQNNRNQWVEWFKCPYDLAMAGSGITNKNTYYKTLNDLQDFGLIQYKKGVNNYKAPTIKIEVLSDTSTVPQSEPQLIPQLIQQLIPQVEPQLIPQLTNNIKLLTYNLKHITINIEKVLDFLSTEDEETIRKLIPDQQNHNSAPDYSKQEFLKDWNELRTKYMKKPSHCNRFMGYDDQKNFESIKKHYTKDQICEGLIGLFRQKEGPNGNESFRTNPSNFLANFERYYQTHLDKNSSVFKKPQEA